MKRYIYGFSKSRREIGAKVEDGVRQLILHMIKLRLYPTKCDVLKWRMEVAEKLHEVSMLKGSHKYPSVQFLLDHTWNLHKTRLSYYTHIITSDYGAPSTYIDSYTLYEDVEKYFIWLCNMLSKHGVVSYKEICNELANRNF